MLLPTDSTINKLKLSHDTEGYFPGLKVNVVYLRAYPRTTRYRFKLVLMGSPSPTSARLDLPQPCQETPTVLKATD